LHDSNGKLQKSESPGFYATVAGFIEIATGVAILYLAG
jgi:hypothetical protein